MRVFEPKPVENFEWVNTIKDSDYELFLAFNGQPRNENWQPVKVRRVRADEGKGKNLSDFPWLGSHALVMRKKAVNALVDILIAHGEILPLEDDAGAELFVYNTKVVNALDEENSRLVKFPGTNKIMQIQSVSFIPQTIRGVDVFRLPHRSTSTYVSERFVNRVLSDGLVGIDFKEVWQSRE